MNTEHVTSESLDAALRTAGLRADSATSAQTVHNVEPSAVDDAGDGGD